MIFSEGRLRQVIRQALQEGLLMEKMSKPDVIKVQQAILAKVPKKDGEDDKAHARRLIGASRPDGDFGKTSQKTWKDVLGLDPAKFPENAEEATTMINNVKLNQATETKPGEDPGIEGPTKPKASEAAINAIRGLWNKHQKFKRLKLKKNSALGMIKATMEKPHEETQQTFTDEDLIVDGLEKLRDLAQTYNRRWSTWNNLDKFLISWLSENDPECANWKLGQEPPWDAGQPYKDLPVHSELWLRATREQTPFKGKDRESLRDFYDEGGLNSSELKSFDRAADASFMPEDDTRRQSTKDERDAFQDKLDLAIYRADKAAGESKPKQGEQVAQKKK